MSKLTDIIAAAEGDDVPVASLLRMTKTLASRMQTVVLDDWVEYELSGYPARADIPEYRGPFQVEVKAEWSGPFNSQLRNVPVAPSAVPKGLRDAGAFKVSFHESVSELEQLAQAKHTLHYAWGTDLIGRLNGEMMAGRLEALQRVAPMHGIVTASRIISPARAGAVVDNVRTRVLSLALELERVAPNAGEPGSAPADLGTVNNIVNLIYGSGNAVAVGSPGAVQLVRVPTGDLDSLLKAVEAAGLESNDVAELEEAIRGDAADSAVDQGTPGSRVGRFMGKLALGGLKSAGKAGIQEGAKVIGELVRAYYGIS